MNSLFHIIVKLQKVMKTVAILFASFLFGFGYATAHDYVARKHLDMASGLSNNYVLSMAVDGDGYVWVGTEKGLNRVSAGCCLTFTDLGVEQTRSARGNADKVKSLFYSQLVNLLFVGTEQGLLVMNCLKAEFESKTKGDNLINYGIEDIVSDGDVGLWLVYGNGQLQHIDCLSLEVKTLQTDNLQGGRCCMDDGEGQLFVGHNKNGMSIIDIQTGRVIQRYYHDEHDPSSIPGDNVRRLYLDSHKHVWVGTDHGLALFDPQKGLFRKVVNIESSFDENVFDIREMSDGRLWIACDMGGIRVFDIHEIDNSSSLSYTENTGFQLSSFNTRALVQDQFDNVWVGNHSTGVDFIAKKEPFLNSLPYFRKSGKMKQVYAIANGKDGQLWVNGDNELSKWVEGKKVGEWAIEGMQNRSHSFARCMMEDYHGLVWLGMEDEGVVRFDERTGRFEHIDIGYNTLDIHSFFEDTDGSIWIGSELGVCIYRHGEVVHEKQIDRLTRKAPVTSFIRLSPNEIAMSTQGNGLLFFNQKTGNGQTLHMKDGLPSENINQAFIDNEGSLWLATNEGIVRIKDTNKINELELFDEKRGLADNQVQAICQDINGRVWASSYAGISCIDVKTTHIYNYNGSSDASANGFTVGAVASNAWGHIAFGAPNGVYYFDPEEHDLQKGIVHPKIAILEIFRPVDDNSGSMRMGIDNQTLKLNHKQNTIRLVVSQDNYAYEGFVDFSYLMDGLDDDWFVIGDDQEVVFHGLKPRHYTFILRAKLKNQDWSEATDERLTILISPPFWKTWWAYLMYLLLFIFCCFLSVRFYKRKLDLQASLKMERMKSQQIQDLNEERLRFFTNLTHELRTPLSLIVGPLDDMMNDGQLSSANQQRIAVIHKSTQRLKGLIDDILEFRKTETQNRRLTVAKGDIGLFVREIVINFQELNRNCNVEILHSISPNLPCIYFDSEVITIILNNLLSNALKYTEKGRVVVSVQQVGQDNIEISVSDTGYGISAEALPHIFDRYYQAKGVHQASGTGIGLALAYALAKLHEGSLSVESKEEIGSRFSLLLPTMNNYPNALHKEDTEEVRLNENEFSEPIEENTLPSILVVEDNVDIRQYIADSFSNDYNIVQAPNGEEGLDLALEHIPDIIVSDVMMPKMSGVELTKKLKEDVRTCHIPIILLTAKVSMEDQEEGYDSGADSYLTKPFTTKLLASRIANLLANRRRLTEQLKSTLFKSESEIPSLSPFSFTENECSGLSQLDRDFLNRLNDVIEKNIMQQELDIAFLTDKMAMSHSSLYRKVKALTGLTCNEYVRKMRLRHCYRLLETGDYNVAEAAMMAGFNQMAHFRSTFKNEFGILPSEVKKKKDRG